MFEDHISGKSLILNKDIKPDCFLETNFFLAESLVINLLGNAVKHSINQGIINIKLDHVSFEISNRGEPPSVPTSKFFDRFYKTDKSSDSPDLVLLLLKKSAGLINGRSNMNIKMTCIK